MEIGFVLSRLSDRQRVLFRLSLLGILAGLITGCWALNAASNSDRLSENCLTSYAEQVGTIPFDAMKECNFR
jgi:hypothetical protein